MLTDGAANNTDPGERVTLEKLRARWEAQREQHRLLDPAYVDRQDYRREQWLKERANETS